MRHARYYQLVNGRLQQALGSDSIVVFHDTSLTPRGRHNRTIAHAQRLNASLNKGYVGYAMFKGANLLNSVPETQQVFPTDIQYLEVVRGVRADLLPGFFVSGEKHTA